MRWEGEGGGGGGVKGEGREKVWCVGKGALCSRAFQF